MIIALKTAINGIGKITAPVRLYSTENSYFRPDGRNFSSGKKPQTHITLMT